MLEHLESASFIALQAYIKRKIRRMMREEL